MPKFLLKVNHGGGSTGTPMEEWDPGDVPAHQVNENTGGDL